MREPDAERGNALRMLVGVAVLGVDNRRDRLHHVEEQPLDFGHQLGAMQRNAGLVPHSSQQFQLGLAELTGRTAIDVEHAQNGVGGSHRRAHHRTNALPDNALAANVALVSQGVVGKCRNALLEHVVYHGARQGHRAGGAAVGGAHRHQVDDVVGAGAIGRPHENGRAIAAADLENRRQNGIEQRLDTAGARQDVGHLVQRRQILLRRRQQVGVVLAPGDLRQKLELGRIDRALHQRLTARFDDAERGGDVGSAHRGPGRVGVEQFNHRGTNTDLVAFSELGRRHPSLVDERAIRRL